jgi:hypothetical protein
MNIGQGWEYWMVAAISSEDLSNRVDDALKEGWILYGNPIVGMWDNGLKYCQAMVRPLPPPEVI